MTVDSGLDLMLVLLYSPGRSGRFCEEIRGITRFVKVLFLLIKEGGFTDVAGEFAFEAYDYGPWSGEIFDNIEALQEVGILSIEEMMPESPEEIADEMERIKQTAETYVPTHRKGMIYSLTSKGEKVGKKVYERLSRNERTRVERVKKKFNRMPLDRLLKHIYMNYPEVTIKSKIKEQVVPHSMFGASPDLPKFEREKEDFRE